MKKKKINSKTGDLFYSLWKKLNDIQFINSVNLIKKRLKINNFEEKRFKNKVILDVGCGSGRFCILANQLKAKKVFGIDGIGMLTYKAIGSRDYGIIMGFVVIGALIRLVGNLISDLCYALIDPRIRFK